MNAVEKEGKCPFGHMAGGGTSNRDWWPNDLRIELIEDVHVTQVIVMKV